MPQVNDDDFANAITAGIAEAGGTVSGDDTDTSTGTEDSGTNGLESNDGGTDDSGSASATDEGGVDGGVGDGAEPIAGAADSEATLDADGKPVAPKADAKDAAKAGEKKPELGADGKPLKAPDPLNDPLPNALKKETKERIQTLISMNKTVTTERDTAVAQRDEIMSFIEDTGATPEQYGETLQVLKLLNSKEPADQEKALAYVQEVFVNLSKQLGKPIPGVDMLEGHEDLRAAVSEGNMSQAHAEELAAARNQRQVQTQQSTTRVQQTQTQQLHNEAVATAKAELNAFGTQMMKTDPQFKAKWEIVKAGLQEMAKTFPPGQWTAIVKRVYGKVQLPTGQVARPGVKPSQPIRGKTPAGGGQRAASTLLDAVNASLGRVAAE